MSGPAADAVLTGAGNVWGLALGLLVLAAFGEGTFRVLRRTRLLEARPGPESVGMRVLLALAIVPWVCTILDLTGIPIRRFSLGCAALLIAGIGVLLDVPSRGAHWRSREERASGSARAAMDALLGSPAALVLALASASLIVMSFVHVSLVPVRTYDALVGYDLVGRIIAIEGAMVSSLFQKLVFNAQCVYAPFTATNDGFWYIFHPSTPELWVPLCAGGFLLVFWGIVFRWTSSPSAAGVATFVTFLPPTVAFHLTVGQTDLPSMAFTCLAIFSLAEWLQGKGGLAPVGTHLLIATTARAENLLMAAALGVVAFVARRGANRLKGLSLVVAPAAFFIAWNLYIVKVRMGYDAAQHFRPALDFDPGRAWEVLVRAATIVAGPGEFGELIWLILLLPVVWVVGRRGVRAGRWGGVNEPDSTGQILAMSAVMFLFYMPYFYMWDPHLNPLVSMEHTYKRGFFRFIPGLVVAFLAAPPVLRLLASCDGGRPGMTSDTGDTGGTIA
jgi:hypothetical protein